MSTNAFGEHGIVFQSMDQVKRYDSLSLLNEHSDPYFYLHNLSVQFIPFKLGKLKNFSKGEKHNAKSVHEARYSRMQIMTLTGTTRGMF